MIRFMLDTDISIFIIKRRTPELLALFNQHQGAMCISSVTLMELYYGAEHSATPEKNIAILEGYAARLHVLEYDNAAAQQTGQIRATLAAAGTPIGPFDNMISGHARSRGFILVSNNTREFARVAGLRLENWIVS